MGGAGEGTGLATRKEFKSRMFLTHRCPQSVQGKGQSNRGLGVQDLGVQTACLAVRLWARPWSSLCPFSVFIHPGKEFELSL